MKRLRIEIATNRPESTDLQAVHYLLIDISLLWTIAAIVYGGKLIISLNGLKGLSRILARNVSI